MRAVLDIILIVLDLYVWLLIASAILSWLIAFNVVNTRNQFVAAVAEFLYRITEPVLAPIRRMMPNLGGLDISPIILILIIMLHPEGDHLLHLCRSSSGILMDPLMDPWRYSTEGISVALRVTPRGGRDDIDGVETLANGRNVVKVRVRAIAEGGEANRAVTELLAKALGVPKGKVRVLSGMTSRLKQIAVDGDPARLGEILRKLTAANRLQMTATKKD